MAARQGIRIKGINKNAKYKVKYTYSQATRTRNGKQNSKYSYKKEISATKRYSYK